MVHAGALVRVIAGKVGEVDGPGSTYTPMTMVHATVEPGARLNLPWNRDFNALVYVLSGRGTVGPVGHPIQQGQLAVGQVVAVHRYVGDAPRQGRVRGGGRPHRVAQPLSRNRSCALGSAPG